MGSLSTPRASIEARWLGPFVPLAPQICSFMAGTEHGGHAAPGGGISVAICHILGHQTSGVIPRLIPAPQTLPAQGRKGRRSPRGFLAASCGNVPPELAGVVRRNAKITCPAAAAALLAPQEPSPGDGGLDAVFSGVQTFWVMFALLWDHGERIPAGRGEGSGQKMHPLR